MNDKSKKKFLKSHLIDRFFIDVLSKKIHNKK